MKFRNGKGNADDIEVCWATDIPLMRVEEMYLIEAEATAQIDAEAGRLMLNDFMKKYRNPNYNFISTDKDEIIDEIFFQKRVELWGEGQILFDFKRLNKSVVRDYDGSNWPPECQFNTNGRPAWMNYVIVEIEENKNPAVKGWNNPNIGGLYQGKN